jgi:hypothetical protein
MAAGNLKKPEQSSVLDDHTIRIDFLQRDKLTLPDLAVVVPAILNPGTVGASRAIATNGNPRNIRAKMLRSQRRCIRNSFSFAQG